MWYYIGKTENDTLVDDDPVIPGGGELRTAHRKYQMRENIQNVPLIKEVMVRADLKLHQEISVG